MENEGIEETIALPLPIQTNDDFLTQGLVIPRLKHGASFDESILLRHDSDVRSVSVDLSARVQVITSGESGVAVTSAQSGGARQVARESLDLVDWQQVYVDLLTHKEARRYHNLVIRPEGLREILEAGEPVYELITDDDDSVVNPRNRRDQERLQRAVVSILRKYTDKFYRHRQSAWQSENLIYKDLDRTDENFQLITEDDGRAYQIEVPRRESALRLDIQNLINDFSKLYDGKGVLRGVHFDRHLYEPLLIEPQRSDVKVSPPALQESERLFVDHLKSYCKGAEKIGNGTELFLLRNLTRGKGVGFFETNWFYPDFILWIKRADGQRIVFVEPHGMVHASKYETRRQGAVARTAARTSECNSATLARKECAAGLVHRFGNCIQCAAPEIRQGLDQGRLRS